MVSNNGHIYNMITNTQIKQELTEYGYYRVSLCMGKRGLYYRAFVHKLVAEYFIENKKDYQNQVNHINGYKLDNFDNNLEFCDQSENNKHAFEIGLVKRGDASSITVYSEEVVRQICSLLEMNLSTAEIAIKLNLFEKGTIGYRRLKDTIHKIKIKTNWAWISREYDF